MIPAERRVALFASAHEPSLVATVKGQEAGAYGVEQPGRQEAQGDAALAAIAQKAQIGSGPGESVAFCQDDPLMIVVEPEAMFGRHRNFDGGFGRLGSGAPGSRQQLRRHTQYWTGLGKLLVERINRRAVLSGDGEV